MTSWSWGGELELPGGQLEGQSLPAFIGGGHLEQTQVHSAPAKSGAQVT